jgi:hypothetical protein
VYHGPCPLHNRPGWEIGPQLRVTIRDRSVTGRRNGSSEPLLTTMWPVKVQRQFDIAQAAGNDALENVLHAPYNKLLNTLFPVDTDFTVIPNCQEINSTKGTDYLVTFEIFLENLPVFVLGLKREKGFSVRSKRTAADDQLRGRLGDLIGNALLPLF